MRHLPTLKFLRIGLLHVLLNVTVRVDSDSFKTLNWRVFFICMVAGFVLALLQNMGFTRRLESMHLLSPSTGAHGDYFTMVKPKLETSANTFTLFRNQSIIPRTFASGEYEEAAGYIVVDYGTGEILASKNDTDKLAIASLTKIMTAVVALDLVDPAERFTATRQAASQIPTKIGLVPGQKLTLAELLHALLLTSANDAAEMIKEGVNHTYQSDIFIRAMNAKADFLRLTKTNFDNPQGFDGENNYASTQDLSVLTHYALENYPLIKTIVAKEYQLLPKDKNHKQYDLYNWNGLLGVYPNVLGMKIGNTEAAGKTTIVVSAREGKKIIVVLLGAPGVLERDLWASQLLDIGFSESKRLASINITEEQLKDKYKSWKYFN